MRTGLKMFMALALAATIVAGMGCSLIHREQSVATQGQVCFNVDPPEAIVSVDGTAVGMASEFTEKEGCIALDRGRHTIALNMDGYQPYEREIYVGTSAQHINIKLIGQ